MARSVSIKIIVLLTIVFVTRYMTTEIMARYVGVNSPQEPTLTKVLEVASQTQTKSLMNPIRKNLSASGRLVNESFQVHDNEVQINASFDMMSKTKGTVHLWRLRAYREGDNAVEMDRPYTNQLFEMHPSGRMTPTFSETIQLPAGQHRVILTLYGVPKGYDLRELDDVTKARAAVLFEIPRVVEVQ